MFATKISFISVLLCHFELHGIYGQGNTDLPNDPANGWNISESNQWYLTYPDCAGRRQSPVNIDSNKAMKTTVPKLQYFNYDAMPINMTLHNSGTGFGIYPIYKDGEAPYFSGGLLSGEYVLQRIHFLSGPDIEHGSSHSLDGKFFNLEMHLTHYKRDYGNLDNALKHADGDAAWAFFIQISDTENPGFAKFTDFADRIIEPFSSFNIDPFRLTDFAVGPTVSYYNYAGSLAFPPCPEAVTFMIPTKPLTATKDQIQKIRAIKYSTGENYNTRPIQPIVDQEIYYVQQVND